MTPTRRRRLWIVLGILAGVSVAGALALSAFRQNVTFYFNPSEVAAGHVHADQRFRLGGMVSKGSVQRAPGSLEIRFTVTDFEHDVPVTYTGVLPDLFREGQGVIAHGRLNTQGVFVADEVLAKHDEKYMPPKIAQDLKARHDAQASAQAAGEAAAPASAPQSPAQSVPPPKGS
jgi:cytochrome c-type biogenesis protein CcmE